MREVKAGISSVPRLVLDLELDLLPVIVDPVQVLVNGSVCCPPAHTEADESKRFSVFFCVLASKTFCIPPLKEPQSSSLLSLTVCKMTPLLSPRYFSSFLLSPPICLTELNSFQ